MEKVALLTITAEASQQLADRAKILTHLAQVGPEGRQELWTDFEAQVAEEAPHFSRVLPRYKKTLDFQLTKMAEDSPRVRR